jgi:hypothetical protein
MHEGRVPVSGADAPRPCETKWPTTGGGVRIGEDVVDGLSVSSGDA